jgi:PIN domain nuclease of toxin-antitoxin system
MQVLLDTHSFLWWIEDSPNLSEKARRIIEDGNNQILVSAASAWEIATKSRLGKLRLPANPEAFVSDHLQANAFQPLPITVSHALHTASLPLLHRDPFDRMIIAQGQLERVPILTSDVLIHQYDVTSIW